MRADAQDAWGEYMRNGDFASAWRVCDRVLAVRRDETCLHLPRHLQWVWNGSRLDGRRVLVRCYHGLGDTIQFARYLPLLCRRTRAVTVWAQQRLIPLLQTIETGAGFALTFLPLHDGEVDAEYDVDVEIMELPHVFRTALDTVPASIPYLEVEPLSLERAGRPAIGLVWRAGGWNAQRSIPFRELAPLLEVDADWYALQNGDALEEMPAGFATPVGTVDIAEAAAAMRALDLVITIDSMTAHLAGALGARVWTLLPFHADWRWMRGRDDSPWYPTMRLFRQPSPGDWKTVIARVRKELRAGPEGREGRDRRDGS